MYRSYYAAGRPLTPLVQDLGAAPPEAKPSTAPLNTATAPAGTHAAPPAPAPTRAPAPTLSACEIELNSQLANRIAWKALACGLVADGFAWQLGIGLNLAVFLALVLLAAASILRLRLGALPKSSARLLGLGGLFATLLILRDAEELQLLNVIACLSCLILSLAIARPMPMPGVFVARVRDVVVAAIRSGVDTVTWALPLTFHLATRTGSHRRAMLMRVARVTALSAAVTITFGALLAAGDPVFRQASEWVLNRSPESLGNHVGVMLLFAWPVAGLFWGATALQPASQFPAAALTLNATLRKADVASALTALNLLFAVFVATQARVLFGGQDYVLSTTGLSLAEYARSGFFTLIFVAGLVLSLLLAFNALLDKPGLGASRLTRGLSQSLLALTSVVLVSAAARMIVYMNAFGASSDRLFAMTVIGWLGVVMAWFAITVLRNRPTHFAFGTLVAGWSTLLAFNVANPHAIIARNHLERAARGELSDMYMVSHHLSLDVIPEVVRAAQREMKEVGARALAPHELTSASNSRTHACGALIPLATRFEQTSETARWSTWNIARARARQSLHRSARELALCR